MRESLSLRFLYNTVPGRTVLKFLVSPRVSMLVGDILNSKWSVYLIPFFVKKNKIDLRDVEFPPNGFLSFNEFFYRKRTMTPLLVNKGDFVSPCDGLLTVVPIRENTIFDIKHTKFSLGDLLHDTKLEKEFENGYALIFRLTPAHYHRYCHVADGRIDSRRRIHGVLHCVRPVATRQVPVFVQNTREYQVVSTKEFGRIVQMEIGALFVGKISNHKIENREVAVGQEKGYFEFGGSTIVVLTKDDRVVINEDLKNIRNSEGEIPVHMGMVVGHKA